MTVVDTNVVSVAHGLAGQANDNCVSACEEHLASIIAHGVLFIDNRDWILESYISQVGHSPTPGIAREFVRWIRDGRFSEPRIRRVEVTPRATGWRQFEEFPNHEDLVQFDGDDHIFVAVALASGEAPPPPILNAVDSDWADHYQALVGAGVQVQFLCPQHCQP